MAALAFGAVLALGSVDDRGLPELSDAWAHSGGLSPKDGCHNSKAEGRRHAHKPGTNEPEATCLERDGIHYRVIGGPSGPSDACESMLRWLAGERTNGRGEYISRSWDGDPLLVQRDAVKLVRACRGLPVQRE